MANQVANQVAKKEIKSKKPFLKVGLILLGIALLIALGYFLTGSIVFARNAIAVTVLGGSGAGLGAVTKKVALKIRDSISKKKSRQRVPAQTITLERVPENEVTMKEEPERTVEKEENSRIVISDPINKEEKSTGKTR